MAARSFRSIVNNLPKDGPADFLHVIREDPYNRDLLFVGSSIGAYVSIDRGQSWAKLLDGNAVGPGVRPQDPSARPRADRSDARPRILDRRHRAARAVEPEEHQLDAHTCSRRRPRSSGARRRRWRRAATATRRDSSRSRTRRMARRSHIASRDRAASAARIAIINAVGDTIANLTGPGSGGPAQRELELPGFAAGGRGGAGAVVAERAARQHPEGGARADGARFAREGQV